jgi:hypothetical protein
MKRLIGICVALVAGIAAAHEGSDPLAVWYRSLPPNQPARQKSFTIWEHRGCVEKTEIVAVSIICFGSNCGYTG